MVIEYSFTHFSFKIFKIKPHLDVIGTICILINKNPVGLFISYSCTNFPYQGLVFLVDLVIDAKWLYYPKKEKLVSDGRLIVENTEIIYSGPKRKSNQSTTGYEKLVIPKGIIVPGFINSHTHIPMTLFRGYSDDKILQEWLRIIWTIEPNMKPEDAYWGTKLGIAEMLACGTVGFNDQYFFSDKVAEATVETGIKAALAPSIFWDGNPESNDMKEAFDFAVSTYKKWNGKNDKIFINLGPHAPYTVDQDWFTIIADKAVELNTGIHTHFNETQYEVEESLKTRGMRPIEYLESIGVLESITAAAHCIFTSNKEKELLKKYNISVLHCPKSNLKIGAGIAEIPEYLRKGINVCLGTDGQASNNKLDMIEELAFEVLLHKGINNDPTLISAQEAFQLATCNGSQLFPKGIYAGTLETGTKADITVIDLDSIHTSPIINPISHLTYSIGRENVKMTIVDGQILYKDGEFSTLNIEEIKDQAQKTSDRLVEKARIK